MKRVLWCSDNPLLPTGYAQVTRNVCSRLKNAGFDMHTLAFQQYSMDIHRAQMDTGWMDYPIHPSIKFGEQYGNQGSVQFWTQNIKPNIVQFLCDAFMIKHFTDKRLEGDKIIRTIDWFKDKTKLYFYFPFDSPDVYTGAKEVLEAMDVRIAMSKFGQKLLKKEAGMDSHYIPHGVDTTIFRPLPNEILDGLRKQNGFDNKFIVGSVFRNQSRKMPTKLIKAFVEFAKGKDDVLLFLHCLSGETPIMVLRNGVFDIIPIRDITEWKRNGGGEAKKLLNIKVWDGKEFVKVLYAKRQVKRKKIIRTLSMESLVDSTPEHLMFKENDDICQCSSLSKDDKIKIGNYPTIPTDILLDNELAWLFGFFVAEGTCGEYKYKNGYEYQWKIDCCDKALIERAANIVKKYFNCKTKIVKTEDLKYTNKKIYRLVVNKQRLLGLYFNECYTRSNHGKKIKREKKVPPIIFISDTDSQEHFLEGYKDGDGHIINEGSYEIKTNSQTLAMGIIELQKTLKPEINVNIFSEERPIKGNQYHRSYYSVTFTKNRKKRDRNKIKKIFQHPSKELYVYDITTESGKFQAGIGNRIVHNCDPKDPQGHDLIDFINKVGIKDKVKFSGVPSFITGTSLHQVNAMYNLMDIHALSTTGEGFGLPIIESMATGVPNVVTDCTTTKELIEGHGIPVKTVDGYGVEGQMNTDRAIVDTSEMAKAFNKYYDNRKLLETHGTKGRQFVLNNYNWEKVARAWCELYSFGKVKEYE